MHATKVERAPVRRSRKFLLIGVAAAALLTGLVVVLVQRGADAPATAQAPVEGEAMGSAVGPPATEVATDFLEAYGAFDLGRIRTYLADDATIASMGEQDDPRLLISWLEATGYRQILGTCEQVGSQASGSVRCPFEFYALRSGEIERGPFAGSSFDLVVQDGKIVHVSQDWEIEEFSWRMWEPFAQWVSKAHPKDTARMYLDESLGGVRLSRESISLWKQNTLRYVEEVERNRRRVARASSTGPG